MPEHRILLVEDNDDDVRLTMRAFAKAGLVAEVAVARDGLEALAALHGDAAVRPDLVLLDLKMPRMDGHELLERLRADARTRTLPIIILTSSVEEQDVARAYAGGANSYVHKPVDYLDFVEAARRLGVYWLETNVPPRP